MFKKVSCPLNICGKKLKCILGQQLKRYARHIALIIEFGKCSLKHWLTGYYFLTRDF